PSFRRWWLIHRGLSYPHWPAGAPAEYEKLLAPLPGTPRVGRFGLNQMLRDLLEWREDLRQAFNIKTTSGYTAALGWLYMHGLREYGLLDHLPAQQIEWLNSAPAAFAEGADDSHQPLSWLMYFVWLASSELQVQFPLTNPLEQRAYLWWFLFDGLSGLGLSELMSAKWHKWLHQPVFVRAGSKVRVPRAALMLWHYRADLQQAFPLGDERGAAQLAQWFATAVQQEPGLRWLDPQD